jgi:hypothetical protein
VLGWSPKHGEEDFEQEIKDVVTSRLVDKSVTISVSQSVRGFLTISQLKLENN